MSNSQSLEYDNEEVLYISCIIPENNKQKKVLYKKFLELAYNSLEYCKEFQEYNQEYNKEYNKESRIVSTSEFIEEYICLELGNGGSWCRMDSNF